jgi:hypothetical protein
MNSYSIDRRVHILQNKTFRVAFPGDDDSGYTLTTSEEGAKVGSYVSFVSRLADHYGFKMTVVPITRTSRELYPKSSFTACVHDVAVNQSDFCIGNFWITPERQLLSSMSNVISSDMFYLVAYKAQLAETGLSFYVTEAGKIFLPFSGDLWFAIMLASVYAALCQFFVDDFGASVSVEAEDDDAPNGREKPSGRKKLWYKKRLRSKSFRRGVAALMSEMYGQLISIVSAAPINHPTTLQGRIINVGFGTFILLFVVAFTGATASSFVVGDVVQATITSVTQAIQLGVPICTMDAHKAYLVGRFPGVKVVSVGTSSEGLEEMDKGTCGCVIMYEDAWSNYRRGTHCNKVAVGTPLYALHNGLPVREDISAAVSYVISQALFRGWYAEEETKARSVYWSAPDCSGGGELEAGKKGFRALTWLNFVGPLFVTFMCSTAGVLVHCLYMGADVSNDLVNSEAVATAAQGLGRRLTGGMSTLGGAAMGAGGAAVGAARPPRSTARRPSRDASVIQEQAGFQDLQRGAPLKMGSLERAMGLDGDKQSLA